MFFFAKTSTIFGRIEFLFFCCTTSVEILFFSFFFMKGSGRYGSEKGSVTHGHTDKRTYGHTQREEQYISQTFNKSNFRINIPDLYRMRIGKAFQSSVGTSLSFAALLALADTYGGQTAQFTPSSQQLGMTATVPSSVYSTTRYILIPKIFTYDSVRLSKTIFTL